MDQSLLERMNYVKLIFLFLDVGANVMVMAFQYLYIGRKPPEEHLIDLSLAKSNNIYSVEKETLQKVKDGDITLNQLDISIMYKLIQLTCGLEPKSGKEDSVWSKNCPREKRRCVEHLLYQYKEERNKIIHDFRSLEFLSNNNFEDIERKNQNLLNSIIVEVGIRAELKEIQIKEWQTKLLEDMNRICNWSTKAKQSSPPSRKFKKKVAESHDSSEDDDEVEEESLEDELEEFEKEVVTDRSKKRRSISKNCAFNKQNHMFEIKERKLKSAPKIYSKSKSKVKVDTRWTISSSDVIKNEILTHFGNQLDHGNDMNIQAETSSRIQAQASSRAAKYMKYDRRFWIDQLVSSNALNSTETMKTFLQDYVQTSE